MIKNRVAQVVFQTVYFVLAVIGFLNSFGYFAADFNANFYVYYTNLSNYICMGFMFVCLVKTIKQANKKEDGFVGVSPKFNFMCVIMIMVTFLVYNILLSGEQTVVSYFTSLSNILMHVILPIMFVVHWVLFYEHNSVKWFYPLLSVIMPLIYVIFILIRAAIFPNVDLLYPYFFLDVGELGWGGFFGWILVLLVIFVAIGYLLYCLDNLKRFKEKKKLKNEQRR